MQKLTYYTAMRPYFGETVSGDAVVVREVDHGLFVGIIDVLGHGREAHEHAQVIMRFLQEETSVEPVTVINRLHEHLLGERGSAAGLCFIDGKAGTLRYTGVGNTSIRIFGRREVHLISQDGVLGHRMRPARTESARLSPEDVVVFYTDGVSSHFRLDDYPKLHEDTVRAIASTIVYRFGKRHDDVTCIAVRYER